MAHLGVVGVHILDIIKQVDISAAITGGDGEITVIAKVLGIPTQGIKISLFTSQTQELVKIGYSGVDGYYTFGNLSTKPEVYTIIFSTSLDYDAIVYDKLTAT